MPKIKFKFSNSVNPLQSSTEDILSERNARILANRNNAKLREILQYLDLPYNTDEEKRVGFDVKKRITDEWEHADDTVKRKIALAQANLFHDAANMLRTTAVKISELGLDADYGDIDESAGKLDAINKIKEYKSLAKLYNDTAKRVQQLSPEQVLSSGILQTLDGFNKRLSELDEYFKGPGRNYDVVIEEMYNLDLQLIDRTGSMSEDQLKSASVRNQRAMDVAYLSQNWNDWGDWYRVDNALYNTLLFSLVNLPAFLTQGALGGTKSVNKTVLKTLRDGDPLIESRYLGRDRASNETTPTDNTIKTLFTTGRSALELDNMFNDQKREHERLGVKLLEDLEDAKNGVMLGFDLYDPEDIPDEWKENQQKYSGEAFSFITHPFYSFPEVGSTIGLFKYLAGAMLIDGGLSILTKFVPSLARNPYAAAAMLATLVGTGIAASYMSRKDETKTEAINAVTQRMLELVSNQGGPEALKLVEDAIKERATKMGADVSNMELDDLIKFGIAFNVTTGNEIFDENKYNVRKGLNKLINANNALAMKDYLEMLPYTSYGGKIANRVFGSMSRGVYRAFEGKATTTGEKLLFATTGSKYGKLLEANMPTLRGAVDNSIMNIARRIAAKDSETMLRNALAFRRVASYGVGAAERIGISSLMEGFEEGQQEILQDRFKRGLYDDYNNERTMFSPSEMLYDFNLIPEVAAAYFGWTPFDAGLDTENIYRSFNAGVAGSIFFGGAQNAFRNVYNISGDGRYSQPETLRQLFSQLKNDKLAVKMVADGYSDQEDLLHAEIFYDQFKKGGVNRQGIVNSLINIRDIIDEESSLVKKEDVNGDIKLANNLWFLYNSKNLDDLLKTIDIVKDKNEDHKKVLTLGAQYLTKAQNQSDLIKKNEGDINKLENRHEGIARQLLDESLSEDQIKELQDKNPNLSHMIQSFAQEWEETYYPHVKAKKLGRYGNFVRQTNNIDLFKSDESIRNVVKNDRSEEIEERARSLNPELFERYNQLSGDETIEGRLSLSEDEEEILNLKDRILDSILEDLYHDKQLRKSILKQAYDQSNKASFASRFDGKNGFENFFRSKYVKQYLRQLGHWDTELLDVAKRIYQNEESREAAIEAAYNIWDGGNLTKTDYVLNRLMGFHNYQRSEALKKAKEDFDKQGDRLQWLRTMIGLDVNNTSIKSISLALDEYLQNLQKQEDEQLNKNTSKDQPKLTYEMFFPKEKGLAFDDSEEYNKLVSAFYLNTAANRLFGAVANAFNYQRLMPDIVSKFVFANTPDLVFTDLTKQYNQLKAQMVQQREDPDVSDEMRQITLRDIEETEKKTAAELIKRILLRRVDREETNKQEKKEFSPVTPADEEAAHNGDKDAQEKIENAVEEEVKRKIEIDPKEDEIRKEFDDRLDEDLVAGTLDEEDGAEQTDEPDSDFDEIDVIDSIDDDGITIGDNENSEPELDYKQPEEPELDYTQPEEPELDYGDDYVDDVIQSLHYSEDGDLMIGGYKANADERRRIEEQLGLLGQVDINGMRTIQLPDGSVTEIGDLLVMANDETINNLVGSTLFYKPNGKEPPLFRIGGKDAVFPKSLGTGEELSKKLSQSGWLLSTRKYFVVGQSQQSLNVGKGGDIRDGFAVALCLEDDEHCYLCFLRGLGRTDSKVKDSDETIAVNDEKELRKWIYLKDIDWDKAHAAGFVEPSRGNKKSRYTAFHEWIWKQVLELAENQLRLGAYNTLSAKMFSDDWVPKKSEYKDLKDYDKAVALTNHYRQLFESIILRKYTKNGKRPITSQQIDYQISKLRRLRNEIIERYCNVVKTKTGTNYQMPILVRTNIVPNEDDIQQSNGKINNEKKDGVPVFKTISDEQDTIDDVQKKLDTGKIVIGYGKGRYATDIDQYAIKPVNSDSQFFRWSGKGKPSGLSGKIYWMLEPLAKKSNPVPVMLFEERFNTQIQKTQDGDKRHIITTNDKSLVLCLTEGIDGQMENTNKEGYLPSAAEVLFYMMMGKVDLGVSDQELIHNIVEFFVHTGEKTLLENQPKYNQDSNPINVFAMKLLYFDGNSISIAIRQENGSYLLRTFDKTDLFVSEDAEKNRLAVIKAIATQLHWNTDIGHMNDVINMNATAKTGISGLILYLVQKQLAEDDSSDVYDKEISILGCPQLSFKVSDFYEKHGDQISPKTNGITVTAWMIKNGKLKTDINKQVPLKDPFVFCNSLSVENESGRSGEIFDGVSSTGAENTGGEGVSLVRGENKQEDKKGKPKNPGVVIIKNQYDEEKRQAVEDEWSPYSSEASGLDIAKNEEERAAILEELNQQHGALERGGIIDSIVLAPNRELQDDYDLDEEDEESASEYVEKVKSYINDFLNKYTTAHPDRINKVKSLKIPKILTLSQFNRKEGALIINIFGNGDVMVTVKNANQLAVQKTKVTGAYSKVPTSGNLIDDDVKKFLNETLGIPEYDIVIMSGVLKSVSSDKVYAVTNLSVDKITGQIHGTFMFGDEGGKSIMYHEAWHYVNLLLHDKRTRNAIYQSYRKSHKGSDKLTDRQIEERLAEEFRAWAIREFKTGVSGIILRAYNKIMDFIYTLSNKRGYRSVFKSIKAKLYKSLPLDRESINEFVKYYDTNFGVEYRIGGLTEQEQSDLGVDNHREFFDAVDAIISYVILSFNIKSISDVKKLTGENFQEVLDKVEELRDEQTDLDDIQLLNNLIRNKTVLLRELIAAFANMGIRLKIVERTAKANDGEALVVTEQPTEQSITENAGAAEDLGESSSENKYDVMLYEISRKENAATATKVFMSNIQKRVLVYDKNGKPHYKTKIGKFGVPEVWDFNEAWNLIITEFYECSKYGRFGDYTERGLTNTIIGKCEFLSKSSPFFDELLKRLNSLNQAVTEDNINLKSQVFSTLNGYRTAINRLRLENDVKSKLRKQKTYDFDEAVDDDAVVSTNDEFIDADVTRLWSSVSDNLWSVIRNIPRGWSKNIFIAGLSTLKNGKQVIDKNFAKLIKSNFVQIYNELNRIDENNEDVVKSVLTGKDGLKEKIINLLNMIGIPVDNAVLSKFIYMYSDTKLDYNPIAEFKALKKIFGTTEQLGSIGNIIYGIADNVGNQKLTFGTGKNAREYTIDGIFDNYLDGTQISNLAEAYNQIHPSPKEQTIKSMDGKSKYPYSKNNFLTRRSMDISDPTSGVKESLRKDPYCKHSIVLDAADKVDVSQKDTKIRLLLFDGIEDFNFRNGEDYFGITPLEDYLSKMFYLEQDKILFPTMADKKTWYAISCSNIKLCHDLLLNQPLSKDLQDQIFGEYMKIDLTDDEKPSDEWKTKAWDWYRSLDKQDPIYKTIQQNATTATSKRSTSDVKYRRFSDRTLGIFANYFIDELNALLLYYSKENIDFLISNPLTRIKNYHGKVKNGKMDFSGNGGKFRYFYDLKIPGFDYGYNLNQRLEALYELLKKWMNGDLKIDKSDKTSRINYKGLLELSTNPKELTGFELIELFLKELKNTVSSKIEGVYKSNLYDAINEHLMSKVDAEFELISTPGSVIQLVSKTSNGKYKPESIPAQFIEKYADQLLEKGFGYSSNEYYKEEKEKTGLYGGKLNNVVNNATFSLIANNVVNTMISVIETEKVYTGDPAFYKWTKLKDKEGNEIKKTISFEKDSNKELRYNTSVSVEIIDDMSSDKIKRLGSALSPGEELRLDYTKRELEKYGMELERSEYTNLNIDDLEIPSVFLDVAENRFKAQILVDIFRRRRSDAFNKLAKRYVKDYEPENKLSVEQVMSKIYYDKTVADKFFNILSKEEKDNVTGVLALQIRPYKNINVCDALVFIRPELYRKIRISLGQWSRNDEAAYKILTSGDGLSWMNDAKKCKIVNRFLTYVLKMAYFQNDSRGFKGAARVNIPILNKQAIFPLFKFHATSTVGKMLYERMNREGNEIDMISFKSAVKVGATQETVSPTNITDFSKSENVKNAIASLDEKINNPSSKYFEYSLSKGYLVRTNNSKDALPITVQNLRYLRMQLNTKAHDEEIRSIGTQMFKIAFSNLIDNVRYGEDKYGENARTGAEIKLSIIRSIKLLTKLGKKKIQKRFYIDGQLNEKAVEQYISDILKNNDAGTNSEDLIKSGAIGESLVKRKLLEQSSSSYVNKLVVDIKTNGGTAYQQSVFGFVSFDSYDNKSVETYDSSNPEMFQYNGGKEISWNKDNGSMEVLLSMNFFKRFIPHEVYKKGFTEARQWLIDHDIINGVKLDGSFSNPQPFGVGYRIPTQGMSSMFVMTVADVLPETVGDLIVVPREFTAQTGSDFDIDKLFIAQFAYDKDGNKKILTDDNQDDEDAIANQLLLDYVDIISDVKNFANSRASIDYTTNIITQTVLPRIRKENNSYVSGMSVLLPSYQEFKKMEFSTGKFGIGPFALNVTNLALTQFVHLTMDFSKVADYKLHDLDEIEGEDGIRISDWLSAMVNAHVDVAKDPYIFTLNINKATYKITNFLLRTGKGINTFYFVSLPILKKYAEMFNSRNGIYKGTKEEINIEKSYNENRESIIKKLYKQYISDVENLLNTTSLSSSEISKINEFLQFFKYESSSKWERTQNLLEAPERIPFSEKLILTEQFLVKQHDKEKNETRDIDYYLDQMSILYAFNRLDAYAQELSTLVLLSQIDTKKFGSTIPEHILFKNNLTIFRRTSESFRLRDNNGNIVTINNKSGKVNANKSSIHALDVYFDGLFLSDKFDSATYYTKDILKNHLYTCTPQFEQMLIKICKMRFGTDAYVDENGDQLSGFNNPYNNDLVQKIAYVIDDILRYLTFVEYGKLVFDVSDLSGNLLMLNIVQSGDIYEVLRKFIELTLGKNNIFDRLYKLTTDIRSGKNPIKYIGLYDVQNKQISNELLNYLLPVKATEDAPIGRIELIESQVMQIPNVKRRLLSAFSLLLDHPNKEVKQLAEDLVFYAYFSSYDKNTRNAFFDLVPLEYRRQYDLALKEGIQRLNSFDLNVDDYCELLIDVISRNMWQEDVVPTFTIPKTLAKDFDDSGVIIGDIDYLNNDSFAMFPNYIMTTRQQNTNQVALNELEVPYIKVRRNGETMLYKNVGRVLRKNSEGKTAGKYAVYIPITKAGIKIKNQYLYEFSSIYGMGSIYEQNAISKSFAEDIVRPAIEDAVKLYMNKEGKKYSVQLIWCHPEIPQAQTLYSQESYIQDTKDRQQLPTVQVVRSSRKYDSEYTGQFNSDVIINLKLKGNDERNMVRDKFKDRTIDLDLNSSEEETKKFLEKLKDLIHQKEDGIVIHITLSFYDKSIDISDNEIDTYILNYLNRFLLEHQNDLNVESLVEAEKNSKNVDRNIVKGILRQEKINKFLNDLVLSINSSGINIKRLSTAVIDESNNTNTKIAKALPLVKYQLSDMILDDSNIVYMHSVYYNANIKSYTRFVKMLLYETQESDNADNNAQQKDIQKPNTDITTPSDIKPESNQSDQAVENETPTMLQETEDDESKNKECGGGGSILNNSIDGLIDDEF